MLDVIVNPAGAGGKARGIANEVEEYLLKRDARYRFIYTEKAHAVDNILSDLCKEKDKVNAMIIGGDGSFNEAVNGIDPAKDVRIGIIPCGSGNDLARSLGISRNIRELTAQCMEGNIRRVLDVAKVTFHTAYNEKDEPIDLEKKERYFNISCGAGFDAEVCARVDGVKNTLNKAGLGSAAYIATAVQIVHEKKRFKAKIQCDGHETSYNEVFFAAVMNQPYEGGGFKFCPDAAGYDEILDLCVGDHLSTPDFFKIFPHAYNGSHTRYEGVHIDKGKIFRITTDTPVYIHTDGETFCKSTDITVTLAERKLQLLD